MMNTQKYSLLGASVLCLLSPGVQAERFDLESAIIESATAKAVGGGKRSGDITTFFTAQKEMVYAALGDLGISLESLPADIRKNLERFHTTNFAAFKMFSLGLNAQDQGKFAEAKAFFEKAVELDPNFQLAGELGVSMPNNNVTGTVQLQAALAAAAKSATSSGKVQVEVDLSGAIAALQSGQTVLVGSKADSSVSSASARDASNNYTSNPPGSSTSYADRKAVGVSYSIQDSSGLTVSVASTNEWTLDQASVDSSGLVKVGDAAEFQATRAAATSSVGGSLNLGDGSTVSWGTWQSGPGSFTVSAKGVSVSALGPQFQYLIGQATRDMPTTGTASFAPAGGFLSKASGTIGIDFVTRSVQLSNLGFDLSGLSFTSLNGAATYSNTIASGFFKGNYTSGSCTGCAAFSPDASVFTGNFLGKSASGLMFSTVLSTGLGSVSGLHAFQRQ
jgi:hypothetical protein